VPRTNIFAYFVVPICILKWHAPQENDAVVIFVLHQVIAEVGPSQSDFENIKFGGIFGENMAIPAQIKYPSNRLPSLQGMGK
jgi:hypothetical protein